MTSGLPGVERKVSLADLCRLSFSRQLVPDTYDAPAIPRPTYWPDWLRTCFPSFFSLPFAPHHENFWEHVWAIKPGVRPKPFIAVWGRGGGKSSSLEPAVITLGVHGQRKYALYISSSQDQADKHVESIGGILESPEFAAQYPAFADRMVGKYGHSRGWRRNRLTTRDGYTIDAAGLDKAVRGIKRESVRPDVIAFDDLDDVLDSPDTIAKKITILTRSILPAGSSDVAIIGVQNLIHQDSIFSRFVDGRADFLTDRLVSGPVPAIEGLTYAQQGDKYVITGGVATWSGQGLEQCQSLMNDIGLTSFLIESQHETDEAKGGLYEHYEFQHCDWDELPQLRRVVVWVDPAVTNTDKSDCQGIQADAEGVDGKIYRLFSWEGRSSPHEALRMAVLKALELQAEHVGVETDQGGDLWRDEYHQVIRDLREEELLEGPAPGFVSDKAGAGHGPKAHRQSLMLADYQRGRLVHVRGTHTTLERALKRFGLRKPFDLADACLVAGTMITTDTGPQAIETIEPGMMVLTRKGYHPVTASGQTGEDQALWCVECDDGRELIGTGNHPVWIDGIGWTRLDSLYCGAILLVCQTERLLPFRESTISAIQRQNNAAIASIIRQESMEASTEPYGWQHMDPFRLIDATKFTTLMKIPSIMPWITSNSCSSEFTNSNMTIHRRLNNLNTWQPFASMRPSGMGRLKGWSGIVPMAVRVGTESRSELFDVRSAVNPSRHAPPPKISRPVKRVGVAGSTGSNSAQRLRRGCAIGVHKPLAQSGETTRHVARVSVRRVVRGGYGAVYNLSVADQPEYFANGILVHNCYWAWSDLGGMRPRFRPVGQ